MYVPVLGAGKIAQMAAVGGDDSSAAIVTTLKLLRGRTSPLGQEQVALIRAFVSKIYTLSLLMPQNSKKRHSLARN